MNEATLGISGRVPRVPLHDGFGRQFLPVTEPATASCTFRDLHGPNTIESLIGGWAAWRKFRSRQARQLEKHGRTNTIATQLPKRIPARSKRSVSSFEKGPSKIKEGLLLSELRLDFGLPIGGTLMVQIEDYRGSVWSLTSLPWPIVSFVECSFR